MVAKTRGVLHVCCSHRYFRAVQNDVRRSWSYRAGAVAALIGTLAVVDWIVDPWIERTFGGRTNVADAKPAHAWNVGKRREVLVRAACDEEFRAQDGWDRRVRRRIEQVSDVFEKRFGIRWVLRDVVEWTSDDSAPTLDVLLLQLERDVPKRGVELVIGFSGQRHAKGEARDYRAAGAAAYLGDTVIVRDSESDTGWGWNRGVLVHELGHVLGAWHSGDRNSVMQPGGDEDVGYEDFDPQSAAMIEFVRDAGFPRGTAWIVGDARRRVDELFDAGHVEGERRPHER
jgi:hypothetical protein